jgi:uncharacterized protein
MKVVIAGGAGSLGRRIAADLESRGDEIVILTRAPRGDRPGRTVQWDGRTVGPWADELPGAALINLAGQLVDRRPTKSGIELLTRSRVEPTRALVNAASADGHAPLVWLQASTMAIYGDAGEQTLDETSPVADGPPQMAGVARAWEAAAKDAPAGRQVVMRTSVALDTDTPVLDRLGGLVRWGLGGRVGSGRQWISWIHIDDFLRAIRRFLDDSSLSGIVHVTGPNPVRNAELMAELRRALHRPAAPPSPAWAVRAAAPILGTDAALALTGRRGLPVRLQEAGFEFRHPELRGALDQLFHAAG